MAHLQHWSCWLDLIRNVHVFWHCGSHWKQGAAQFMFAQKWLPVSVIPHLPEFLCLWGCSGLLDFSRRKGSPDMSFASPCPAATSGGERGATLQLLHHSTQEGFQFLPFPAATISSFQFCRYLLWKISQCPKNEWEILARGPVRMSNTICFSKWMCLQVCRCIFKLWAAKYKVSELGLFSQLPGSTSPCLPSPPHQKIIPRTMGYYRKWQQEIFYSDLWIEYTFNDSSLDDMGLQLLKDSM